MANFGCPCGRKVNVTCPVHGDRKAARTMLANAKQVARQAFAYGEYDLGTRILELVDNFKRNTKLNNPSVGHDSMCETNPG